VEGASLTVAAGQTLCVVGESGSGKSVMAMAVMGLLAKGLQPKAGRVQLKGEDLLAAGPQRLRQLRGAAMGMMFQEPMTALNPVMPCGRQVDELLAQHTDWPAAQRRAEVLRIFDRVRLPEPARMVASYPHQLSGGQRQRIVIAMATVLKPALLICDEPTTALDVTTQKEILSLVDDMQRELGQAVLFITHDMGVVAEIADQVAVMHQGHIVEQGPREAVLRSPREAYTRQLLAAVPSMTPPPQRPVPQAAPALSGQAVSKTYVSRSLLGAKRETAALQAASISVRPGETVGVVGESGSGKSTLARCLIRLIDPSGGEIHWGDASVAHLPERQLRPLRNRVQVVFQDPNRSLNPRLKVGESLIEGAVNFGLAPAQARELAQRLMDRVKLPREGLQRYPSQFSGGQRQRLAIARALACQPKVLIADEAVSALDVSVQADIMRLLREIQADEQLAMLFITHDLRVAAQLCDRVVVMHQGRIVEEGSTAALYAAPQHPYTQRLFAAAPGAASTS
jgi:peptide/nickel transport system ATP-binding protein